MRITAGTILPFYKATFTIASLKIVTASLFIRNIVFLFKSPKQPGCFVNICGLLMWHKKVLDGHWILLATFGNQQCQFAHELFLFKKIGYDVS